MCGIAGIVHFTNHGEGVDRNELRRIRDAQAVRGPDGTGEWFSEDNRVALGHRRLAIIGLDDSSAQPMVSRDGRFVLVFNGEIYNYRELKKRLTDAGRVFSSESDTEVLLHLYEEQGAGMVRELRGMFAFALWDGQRQRLLLARDAYGIKPLYYSWRDGTLRFASQVRALLRGGGVSRRLSPAGLVGFLSWGSVPEPLTCFEDIHGLPSGATLTIERNGPGDPERYFDPRSCYQEVERNCGAREKHERLRAAFEDSIRAHLVADVPVGAFLSAGVDSTAIVQVAARLCAEPLRTVTLAFDEFAGKPTDEAPLAERTARELGCDHRTIRLNLAQVLAGLDEVARVMDQPSVDGVNSYWVSRAAHERGLKVALSGLGGDELMGGYPSFKRIPRLTNLLRWPARLGWLGPRGPASVLAGRILPPGRRREKYLCLLQGQGRIEATYFANRGLFMPHELGAILGPDYLGEGMKRYSALEEAASCLPLGQHPERSVAVLEQSFYMRNQLLRDADWASMAHSLEVRVPLVDRSLYEAIAPLLVPTQPGQPPKAALAQAVGQGRLNAQVTRRKTGFAFPFQQWLRQGAWRPWPEQLDLQVFSPQLPGLVSRWKHEALRGRLGWARPHAVNLLVRYLAEA